MVALISVRGALALAHHAKELRHALIYLPELGFGSEDVLLVATSNLVLHRASENGWDVPDSIIEPAVEAVEELHDRAWKNFPKLREQLVEAACDRIRSHKWFSGAPSEVQNCAMRRIRAASGDTPTLELAVESLKAAIDEALETAFDELVLLETERALGAQRKIPMAQSANPVPTLAMVDLNRIAHTKSLKDPGELEAMLGVLRNALLGLLRAGKVVEIWSSDSV